MGMPCIILLTIVCACATFLISGIWVVENDNDNFRKKHGYKPKYHYRRKEENDKNQDQ